MTGVEVIAAALAAGAGAGVTTATSSAVQDAYTALRDALGSRLSGRGLTAPEVQEADPRVLEAVLGDELIESGADRDENILATAQRLLALTDPFSIAAGKYVVDARKAKGVQFGDHNVQHNTF